MLIRISDLSNTSVDHINILAQMVKYISNFKRQSPRPLLNCWSTEALPPHPLMIFSTNH